MNSDQKLPNYINGEWQESAAVEYLDILNPATAQVLGQVPLSPAEDVDLVVQQASKAYLDWRKTPAPDRIQTMFKLKELLEENIAELAKTITLECGKTLAESRGEIRRAIENVEVACGIPMLMQGDILEDVASGIDEFMIRQPLGVCAAIAPFNFPGMIPFWFFPYAVACGNTYIVKPSEKVPLTMQAVFQLLDKAGFPPGVINLVHGANETVDALLTHPDIKAISFVGSTNVAKYVYSQASANGKRVQAQGGAKNPIVVLPDADLEMTTRITADSAFGCAGQRCLAASVAITVGAASDPFIESIADAAASRVVGYGMDAGVEMGTVINNQSKQRIEALIEKGVSEGAALMVDGRDPKIEGYNNGSFVRPTILHGVDPASQLAKTEIFGPVLSLMHVDDIDQAIQLINSSQYGNMACLFTTSGAAARQIPE